jgi:hypothetical protein
LVDWIIKQHTHRITALKELARNWLTPTTLKQAMLNNHATHFKKTLKYRLTRYETVVGLAKLMSFFHWPVLLSKIAINFTIAINQLSVSNV